MQNIIGSFTQLLILPSPLLVSWSSRNFLSTTHPTNNEKNMPPTGNNMLDDTKSNKSNNVFPQMVNELITPNDNEQSTPRTKHIAVFKIVAFFRDIFKISDGCRFNNCTHTHEPGCAVLEALEQHRLAPSRYASYLSMRDDKDEAKYRPAF